MNKIIKKAAAVVTALAVAFAAFVFDLPGKLTAEAASSGSAGDSASWTLTADGTLTISGTGPLKDIDMMSSPKGWDSGADYPVKKVVIQSGITSIGRYFFHPKSNSTGLYTLESVTIEGNTLTSIGYGAFYGCVNLTSITLPNSVTTIGKNVFQNCKKLSNITIPNSVTSIGDGAFYSCTSLTSITIPESVLEIGSEVFDGCSSLKSAEIFNGTIGTNAFHDCTALTDVTLHDGVTEIGVFAFYGCTALTAITIPKSVTTIKRGAFNNTTALASITFESETPPTLEIDQYGAYWFDDTPIASGTGKIYVPCGSANAYKTAANWSDYASWIEGLPHTPVTDPAVAATCTTAEKTAGSHCSVCNAVITAQTTVAAKGHTEVTVAAKDPTCTETGLTEGKKCSVCGTITKAQTTVAAKGHTAVTDAAVAATCTTAGKTAGSHCSVCNTTLTAQTTVAATGHKWGNWTITKEPTLTAAGSAKHTCTNDSSHTATETVAKLTDTSVWTKDANKSKPATEESAGEDVYTSEYGEVKVTLDKLEHTHNWSDWNITKEPSFSKTGTAERVCTKDSSHTETAVVPKLTDPSWTKDETTKPTVKEDGEYTYTSEYGDVTVTVPKLTEPSWTKDETTKPTVDTDGEYTYTNDDFGEVRATVPKLSDDTVWTKDENRHEDNTEEHDGRDVYNSDIYGTVEVVLPQLAHDHDWGKWSITTPPTIDTNGTAARVCKKFSSHTETITVPKLADPEWTKTENKNPTIKDNGEYTYTSENYGDVTVTVPKLSEDPWSKTENAKPTVKDNGEYTYRSDYGDVTVTVPKLSDETVWKKTETEKPTLDTDGEYTYTSGYGEETVTVPKLSDETVWTKDETKHVEPKEDEDGKDVYKSEYGEGEVALPATGLIRKQVQSGENAPTAKLPESGSKLVEAVLTEEERSSVENDGAQIKILLIVDDATNSVSEADKTAVEAAIGGLNNYKLGQYLDVNLFKVVNGKETPITETSEPITVMLEIPAKLRGSGRTYSVIRVHDGETTVLNDTDSNSNTITIKTDKFSTYALAYREKTSTTTSATPRGSDSGDNTSSGGTSGDNTSIGGNPATGIAISFVPLVAVFAVLTLTITRKRK